MTVYMNPQGRPKSEVLLTKQRANLKKFREQLTELKELQTTRGLTAEEIADMHLISRLVNLLESSPGVVET